MGSGGVQLYTDNQWSMGNCYKWDLVEYSCILTNQCSMGNCYKWDLVEYSCILTISGAWGTVTVVYKLHRTSFSSFNSFHIDLRNILQNINNYLQFLFHTKRSPLNSRRSANRGAGTEFLCAHPQFKHCDHYRLQLQFVD